LSPRPPTHPYLGSENINRAGPCVCVTRAIDDPAARALLHVLNLVRSRRPAAARAHASMRMAVYTTCSICNWYMHTSTHTRGDRRRYNVRAPGHARAPPARARIYTTSKFSTCMIIDIECRMYVFCTRYLRDPWVFRRTKFSTFFFTF
jgi:hypothetical protein